MKIVIEYESTWRNSFLSGSNNEALPKKGRDFVASMTNLKKEENYIERKVTIDTVMGLLNRLIGDQRKLYQARSSDGYYFKNIEPHVSFEDDAKITNEVAYIRNMKGSTDQNSYTGMILSHDPMFEADYAPQFWGILALSFDQLCHFIVHEALPDAPDKEGVAIHLANPIAPAALMDPLAICDQFDLLAKQKAVANVGLAQQAVQVLDVHFPNTDYFTKKGEISPSCVYCSALYLQLERLSGSFDMESAKTKSGSISGISKRSFTKKDFMHRFTTGDKKRIWGNPYVRKQRIKGLGEVVSTLQKARGKLNINLAIDKAQSNELKDLIECAGVSSFYLGKKGLAYVSKIRV